jgi:hypothetical protein
MSKFLGISYNKWHGVLGFLIQVIGISTSGWWLHADLLQVQFILAIAATTLFNSQLQLTNEWFQLTSKNLIKNYGSLKNAQANSKDDMKWWLLGILGGTFFSVIVLILIDKL